MDNRLKPRIYKAFRALGPADIHGKKPGRIWDNPLFALHSRSAARHRAASHLLLSHTLLKIARKNRISRS